jgi:hypothetical protein
MAGNQLNNFKISDSDEKWTTSPSGKSGDSKLTFCDSEDDEELDLDDIDVIKLDPGCFEDAIKYRAEGNANIVIALLETCQIMRFKKTIFNGGKWDFCH